MKKILTIIAVFIIVLAIAIGAFALRFKKMAKVVQTEYAKITEIDLNALSNGIYNGSFGDFLVFVDLSVTIKDHRITDISIKHQKCGKGYDGKETLKKILQLQSVKVDAVTGATGSSKSIMIAAYRALSTK